MPSFDAGDNPRRSTSSLDTTRHVVLDSETLSTVARWLDDNASSLGLVELRRNTISDPAKLHARYETGDFLVSVTACAQGACLDIDILEKATGRTDVIVQGPCGEQSGVLERLNVFARRLTALRRV